MQRTGEICYIESQAETQLHHPVYSFGITNEKINWKIRTQKDVVEVDNTHVTHPVEEFGYGYDLRI